MDGSARVHGAVTVVNAIPAGGGAAMGVDLWTEARIDLTDGPTEVQAKGPEGPVDDTLVRAVLAEVLPADRGARVEVDSTVPVGRGLKSSSACANAVTLAAFDALDRSAPLLAKVRIGVEAARRAGVTTTGAFDDACASALGGICVTDNAEDRLLARHRCPELTVALAVPEARKSGASTEPGTYASHRRLFEAAHRHAIDGSWQAAFALNATAVVDSLDLDADGLLDALAAGAVVAGPSGTGPALAALMPDGRTEQVRDALDVGGVDVRTVQPTSEVVA